MRIVAMMLVGLCLWGCAAWTERPPIETMTYKFLDEAVIPGVREGLSHGVEKLTIQAGAQAVNPTYVITFDGKWVVGIEGQVTAGVTGISGQVQITTLSPAEKGAPATQPAATTQPTAEQAEIDRRQTSASGELQSEIDKLREAGTKPAGP
jgi:hypothetical protein